jgi:pilus assembly protein CpaF
MTHERTQGTGALKNVALTQVYQDLKFHTLDIVHDYLDHRGQDASGLSADAIKADVARALPVALSGAGIALNSSEKDALLDDIFHEITGFGPLQPLLLDDTVDDIIVNGYNRIYVERDGVLAQVNTCFRDDHHLLNVIHRIVSPLGRRVDESAPFVDARLPDGSRVNIAIPPVAIDGPSISIRKFKRVPLTMPDLVKNRALGRETAEFLQDAVRRRLNILVCGGTGSGKTTLLNVLSSFVGPTERIITIEDAAELQLRSPHVLRMETREACAEGARRITSREILRNALRMRPDRIILGEVRGDEVADMLQAMTTGHDGSMSTVHANNPKDAVKRIELLLGFAGVSGDPATIRRQIASAIHLIVHVQRCMDGVRRVRGISQIAGMEGDIILFNDIAGSAPEDDTAMATPLRRPA